MTSKEYVAWLEVSLITALNTIESNDRLIVNLMRDNLHLGKELFAATKDILDSPWTVNDRAHIV